LGGCDSGACRCVARLAVRAGGVRFSLLLPERLLHLRIVVSVDPYLLHSLSAHRICSVRVAFAPIASAVQRACPDCIYGCAHGTCPHRICAARIRF